MNKTIKVSEAKQGEWYDKDGIRVFAHKDGAVISFDGNRFFGSQFDIIHLPDCTGWDWKPVPPKTSFNERWHCFACGAGGAMGNFCYQCAAPKDFSAQEPEEPPKRWTGTHVVVPTGKYMDIIEVLPGDIDPDRALELVDMVLEFTDAAGGYRSLTKLGKRVKEWREGGKQ